MTNNNPSSQNLLEYKPSLQNLLDYMSGTCRPEVAARFQDPETPEGRLLTEVQQLPSYAFRPQLLDGTAVPLEDVLGTDEPKIAAVRWNDRIAAFLGTLASTPAVCGDYLVFRMAHFFGRGGEKKNEGEQKTGD